MPHLSSPFALPDRLAAKADPALIAGDERHFVAVAAALAAAVSELTARLDELRRAPGGDGHDQGQEVMDRDLEIHRLSARLRTLRRFSLDLCLGRIVPADGEPVYIGRLSLSDTDGSRLLIDWRAPAAEPFFAATYASPMGLASRRRYRWSGGRITDYWDEAFTAAGLDGGLALDGDSALIASLGASRSPRMRDVLATIQADQDAIIRADSRGALVVDGGPGTGKTVVALHRTAYLLYADPRLDGRRGGVLFVGPSRPYLAYVSDVLPSLGEEGVMSCTLSDLVPDAGASGPEPDARVAELKASARLVDAVEAVVQGYETPPAGVSVETQWGELWLGPDAWSEAFGAVEAGTPHNSAREEVRAALIELVADALGDEDGERSPALVRRVFGASAELDAALRRAWPLLEPAGVVAELWSSRERLRAAAPWLTEDEVRLLQRDDPSAWTRSDLPYLDAARLRVGDPGAARRATVRRTVLDAQHEEMSLVIDDLIAADDSEMGVMSILKGQDARNSLVDESEAPALSSELLAGPFAHVVVDEAQELTDAEWRMLLARCPSRSFTVVGDRAQARRGFAESWADGLTRAGLTQIEVATLSVNYRTPEEVMTEAEPVIRAVLPDANVPTAIRSNGIPVRHGEVGELRAILDEWLATHAEGVACVIGALDFRPTARVQSLSPELAKGLEFDLVVLVDPDRFGVAADGEVAGAVDRYVAMTRATERLVILASVEGA